MTKGGALKSVRIVTADELLINGGRFRLQQGAAIKVRGYTTTNIGSRMIKGGDAQPVYVLSDTDIKSAGGRWRVNAGQAIQVTDVIGDARGVIQGAAIPVFPVDDDGNFDPTFSFSPASISGLQLWLSGDTITGLIDTNPVANWPDQSGNGNDAVQGVGADQPLYRTGILNGLPVVRFDGLTDVLATAALTLTNNLTVLVVHTGSNNETLWSDDSALGTSPLQREAAGVGTSFPNAAIGAINLIRTLNEIQISIFRFDYTADTYNHRQNGQVSVQNVVNRANPGGDFLLGARNGTVEFVGTDMAEVLFYSRLLTTTEMENLEIFYSNKYGIALV